MTPIVVNLWDDYADDGLADQNTFAYVEGKEGADRAEEVLGAVLDAVLAWASNAHSPLAARLAFHDSALVYPHLVGTDREWCLYKRWEVKIEQLSHEDREALVDALNQQGLVVGETPVKVISES